MQTIHGRPARARLAADTDNWRTVRLRTDIVEEMEKVAESAGLSLGEAIRRLLENALPRVCLRKVPVYRYELAFMDKPHKEDEADA